jgi:hypothetical protein
MPYINSTEFGSITIDDKKYDQVLIVGEKVEEREYDKLKDFFGTSHKIGEWELLELFNEKPEIIIIGTGQSGALTVDEKVINTIKEKGIELIIVKTPEAIISYNKKIQEGKKVNSLIHTTC